MRTDARDKAFSLGCSEVLFYPLNIMEMNARLQAIVSLYEELDTNRVNILSSVGRNQTHQQKLVAQACGLLTQDFDREWRMEELCNQLGTNRNTLSKLFKNENGMTVFSWLKMKKMHHARHLLENNMLSIQDVAIEVGIDDAGNFSNAYKKAFGISPTKYRKMMQAQHVVTQ